MNTQNNMLIWGLAVSLVLATTGCETAPVMTPVTQTYSKPAEKSEGQQGDVAMVDPQSRPHLQAELHMGDYVALAEKVTNKMLASSLVQKWGNKRPRLIVGILMNNTDNEGIRMRDLHDRIQEVIFNSGLVRIVDQSATNFKYVIKSELTSSRQYGKDHQELVYYTLQLKMFTIEGELVGQWSDDLVLARTKQKLL